ncbi:MAG: Periplasmic binding protein and sugar binding domain of LacI family [Verrucomicrobiota bacterium]
MHRRPVEGTPLLDGAGGAELTLKGHPQVTAIFAANDVMAFGAVRAILERGFRIP